VRCAWHDLKHPERFGQEASRVARTHNFALTASLHSKALGFQPTADLRIWRDGRRSCSITNRGSPTSAYTLHTANKAGANICFRSAQGPTFLDIDMAPIRFLTFEQLRRQHAAAGAGCRALT